VLALRERQRRGQDWLAPQLGVPARTVSRILRRHRMPYLRALDPLTGASIPTSKTTAVRYERERLGGAGDTDVKKIGRIPDGGWRAHGRAARDRDRTRTTGFDFVHSLVDDHSRLAYSEVLPDEKGPTCAGAHDRVAIASVRKPERDDGDDGEDHGHGSEGRHVVQAPGGPRRADHAKRREPGCAPDLFGGVPGSGAGISSRDAGYDGGRDQGIEAFRVTGCRSV
jgi:hypothetical protein